MQQMVTDLNMPVQLHGVPVIRERWKRGVSLVEGAMGEAVGRVYVERHFPPAAKEAMDELEIDYHGGLRYPHLQRIEGTPDYLSQILASRP